MVSFESIVKRRRAVSRIHTDLKNQTVEFAKMGIAFPEIETAMHSLEKICIGLRVIEHELIERGNQYAA